ncbi:Saposin B-type domain-containing protein [Mycena sanguinolenta]|uniref:Saposin B-type domain-containing protein n=1 Tax=Mycena sanguinolenta TaxID=230812 RepID=A0A8H6ZIU9_9AGAR|nr:Saposin B-type domain-containing protein [Mycena sanguinolenta]
MATPPPIPPPYGTLGDIQIAMVVATWLFGIVTLQTFNYYRDFANDRTIMRALVGGIWLLELGYTIACWHAMYLVTVSFYGQPEHIFAPPISMVFPIFFNALIAIGVQTFFVYRVWVVSKQWHIPVLCCAMNIVRLGFNMLVFAKLWQNPIFSRLNTELNWPIIVGSAIGPAVDMIVATSLIFTLWHQRRTGVKRTSRIIDDIIIWTVETTLLTTMTGVMQLVLFLARRNDLSWLVFFLIQGKLFSNTLLASLNGRKRFRESARDPNMVTFSGHTGNAAVDTLVRMHQMSQNPYEDPLRPHGKDAEFT